MFGKNAHKTLQRFEAATQNPYTSAGTPTYEDGGLKLSVTNDADAMNAIISSLPYRVEMLKAVEFVVNLSALDANVELVVGIADTANVDPTAIATSCLAKIHGDTVTVYSDDGTNAVAEETGFKVTAGWIRVRFDFWQQTQTVSPGPSKGYQATVHITNETGFARQVKTIANLDLDAVKASPISPYASLVASGAPSGTVDAVVQSVCTEWIDG